MDITNPNTWTPDDAAKNKQECVNQLKEINAMVIKYMQRADFAAAVTGLDGLLNGAVAIHNAGVGNMKPFLAANSFSQGLIIACGMKTAPDDKRRESAIAAIRDAQDYSAEYDNEYTKQIIIALQSKRSFDSIRQELCPRFREDIIASLEKNFYRLDMVGVGNHADEAENAVKRKRRRKILLIVISAVITLVSALTATKIVNDNKKADKKQDTAAAVATEEPTEEPTQPPTEAPTKRPHIDDYLRAVYDEHFYHTYPDGEEKEVIASLPEILIDSDDARALNQEFTERWKPDVESVIRGQTDPAEANYSHPWYAYYEAVLYHDVLSIYLTEQLDGGNIYYYGYNMNVRTGKRITPEETCQLMGLDYEETYRTFVAKLEEYYNEKWQMLEDSPGYSEFREKTFETENLRSTPLYIGVDGSVYAVTHVYMAVGGCQSDVFLKIT